MMFAVLLLFVESLRCVVVNAQGCVMGMDAISGRRSWFFHGATFTGAQNNR